ncbi:MAG: hypothetical protein KatS3mg006_0753 [Pyrinomonadaceae bacterium]|jgi:type II secretory pathway pseudopilin PulG|nr:MAG: hypothetical protein KatS3mg006_0753 [Pyrinomonadaceae bacterium]
MARGFSIVELIVVIMITMIIMAITFAFITNYRQVYRPSEQVLQIADILREARQRALTQRRTMRVEVDITGRSNPADRTIMVRLIDENTNATDWQDDREIRRLVFSSEAEVAIAIPDISAVPSEMISVTPINGCPLSVYPSSVNRNVCTFRFLSNGTVVDAGTDAIGSNANPVNAALYVWSRRKDNPNRSEQAYGLTILWTSGFVRMWRYNYSSNRWEYYY